MSINDTSAGEEPGHESIPDEDKRKIRLVRVFFWILIGVVLAWFLVETFFPPPFPNMAL